MAKIVVTGAAGFIGNEVTRKLLADGHSVLGIDSLNDAYGIELKKWRLDRILSERNFVFSQTDIRDRKIMEEVFGKASQGGPIDAIIHLAAYAGVRPSVDDPWKYIETNVTGTLNLLDLARVLKIPKFVLASTSSVYGNPKEAPYREDQNTDFSLSPYASSKKAAELLSYNYHVLHGLDVTVFRYFTVYGPAGRPDMSLFRFVQRISEGQPITVFGDGTQSRDFTYIEDIARGTILGLKRVGFQVLNLGSDEPVSVNRVIEIVEKAVGKKATRKGVIKHMADVERTWANVERARSVLGWTPEWNLQRGIERLAAWYEENREWAKAIPTQD